MAKAEYGVDLALSNPALSTARNILQRARANGWSDVDPYDGLAGYADRLLPRRALLARRLLIQSVMRSPPAVRNLLGISPRQEPYTAGVLLSAASLLDDRFSQDELLEVLATTCLPDGAWGYSFPVVTRAASYGPDSPNLISTSFAALGLLDYLQRNPSAEGAKAVLKRGVAWIVAEAWDSKMAGFRYHAGNPHLIFNASALAACVVGSADELFGSRNSEMVQGALQRVMEAQQPDGAWPYGDTPRLGWVDSHHTGFVLKSLLLTPQRLRPAAWDEVTERGLRFYRTHLMNGDGAPRATPTKGYPRDSLAAGQAIETLALAAATFESHDCARLSRQVLAWSQENLTRTDGRYRFRLGRFFPWPGAYLRWGEVHIALGAAQLSQLDL